MKIKIMENGPILIDVSAAVVKKGDTEETFSGKTLALCRCGHSANKPFCDGSHKKAQFSAEPVEIEVQ